MTSLQRNLSFRAKVIGLVLFVCVLMGAGSWYELEELSGTIRHDTLKAISQASVSVGTRIGAQFYERYGDVQAFAANKVVRDGDRGRMQAYLDEYVRLYGIYDVILVVDKNGHYVSSNSVDSAGKKLNLDGLKGTNFAQSPWLGPTLKGEFTADKTNGFDGTFVVPLIEDAPTVAALGESRRVSIFAAQIKNERGEVVGAIANFANTKWFENEMQEVYRELAKGGMKKAGIAIYDAKGIVQAKLSPVDTNWKEDMFRDPKVIGTESVNHDFPGINYEQVLKETVPRFEMDHEGQSNAMFIESIENKKWISSLGWSVNVWDDSDDTLAVLTAARHNFMIIMGSIIFLGLALAVWFGLVVGKQMQQIVDNLDHNSTEVNDASNRIASSATEISESSTQQAAALQETVSAIDEINAMVEKNADAANRSKDVSGQSRTAAQRGRDRVENMISAIDQIDHSNNDIQNQMQETNRQLGEITRLINDIGNKTKVINEIVFQTKLLSFNASVEAARAGEYGKGFAVVAEEVGNLAQMSGNAAKEITQLLDESVGKVDSIISETRTRVDRLMASSKEKIEAGSQTAKECNDALNEILTNVESVDALVSEIAVASREQATGIQEISKAVGQMEQAVQQNSSVAQMSSVSAEQLRTQSEGLKSLVDTLVTFVHGHATATPAPTTRSTAKRPSSKPQRRDSAPSEKKNSNVLPFRKSKASPAPENQGHDHSSNSGLKKASGSEYVPSSNDPGFEE